MIQPATLTQREAAGGQTNSEPTLVVTSQSPTSADVAKWTMELMKMQMVAEVYAKTLLTLKIMLL
jgi:hypothetical protein